jgi:Xaa-Pro dipeptidase
MIDCVLSSSDNKILINVLHCFNGQSLVDLSQSIEKLVSEMLLRNVDNKLSIDEICETVKILYQVKQNSAAEKFWLNIKDHEKKITATNIKHVYELLKYVKISRRFILGILERKITDVWFQLSTQDILDILEILNAVDLTPYVSIHSLSRFLYVNIQSVDENSLLKIVNKFKNLSYMDENIQMALEKYCKTKCIKIKNPELLIELLDYCKVNRFRNFHVLNGACEYFILNSKLIKPVHIKKLMDPLGFLDFQPINATNFWKAIEKYLEQQFTEIPPTDIIDIMLSCCYVEKFPLNFTPKIFNTYFLDLLHSSSPPMKLQKMRQNLKLFDFTMTLECSDYSGPYLPKDHTGKSLWQDGRINRLINNINENLTEIVGSKASFSKSVILYQLPFNELFIIDILYHPAGMLNTWNIKMLQREKNLNVAVLIHLPEHFSADGYLIGPQSMRIRQFRKLGLKVATLKYDALMKLKIHPNELDNYLKERMKLALEAL